MKFRTLQIVWHDKQPVFAAEFLSTDVVATTGADKTIRTWRVRPSPGSPSLSRQQVRTDETGPSVDLESELTGISGAANCLRRSPRGEVFASGGDKGEVVVWKPNPDYDAEADAASRLKPWKPIAFLRGHANDVFDMAWSSDGTCLATASLEGVTIVWDVHRERPKARLCDHHHYVQGVGWDPMNQFLVTQGGDRRCKVYTRPADAPSKKETSAKTASQWRVGKTLFRAKTPSDQGMADENGDRTGRDLLFHDDTLASFFRRLDWSPEGSFLVIPAGLKRFSKQYPAVHVAYIYHRGKWSVPAACLSGMGEPFVVIRCCPTLFELPKEPDENASCMELPYSIIFACATLHHVLIYTSSSVVPLVVLCGLHYSEITDLAWSPDTNYLIVTSRDGYCSMLQFEEGDLGTPLNKTLLQDTHPTASVWLRDLEELQSRIDLSPAKRQIQPQSISKTELSAKGAKEGPSKTKRRIAPIAVAATTDDTPVRQDADEKVADLFSNRQPRPSSLFSDLQKFSGAAEDTSEQPVQQNSLADLLAMTQNYTHNRFGESS